MQMPSKKCLSLFSFQIVVLLWPPNLLQEVFVFTFFLFQSPCMSSQFLVCCQVWSILREWCLQWWWWFHSSSTFQSFDVVEFCLNVLLIYCGLNGNGSHVWVFFGYIFTAIFFTWKRCQEEGIISIDNHTMILIP
jgi:hypothetical protein